jgi:surfeit locus 1 family protein
MSPRARVLLVLSFVIVSIVCARLGVWQVHRLRERRAANKELRAALTQPPVELVSGIRLTTDLVNRRVRAVGHYDHVHDVVLRGRAYQGVPGVEIVSPLVLSGGRSAVLVNRGFVPAPDATTADPDTLGEPGEVVVEGIALPMETGNGMPLEHAGRTTWARLDAGALRRLLSYSIGEIYLREFPDSTKRSFPRRLDPPPLDDGPHLSYSIQWFAFSLIALVFAGIVATRKR